MAQQILTAFYLLIPAYLANMAPVIFGKLGWLESLNRPVDGGRKFGHDYLFGAGKTWRGIVSAVIIGAAAAGIQAHLQNYDFFQNISLVDYKQNFIVFGALAGFGAIMGDLIKSFFKRRIGIKSGGAWPVLDQLDFVAGFFIFTSWLVHPPFAVIGWAFAITFFLHPFTNAVSYWLGIKKVWW